ncbi:hypothetical protein [Sphingosinicella sp. BN140058]|uniref:hypothetical protein n=1 Tax=Sphingosinicella sp. BN140058 TaxID=1892855 RepID=UPI00101259E3|nr:hypothetical protein [Sphingosinicella sp. BN140058]QAY75162.1 hypothetical protein ETR14_00415 [Sphingosinicella sp. BN140058]
MFPDWMKPWLWIAIAIGVLVPLIVSRPSAWWGTPVRRKAQPVRFWWSLSGGCLLLLISLYALTVA